VTIAAKTEGAQRHRFAVLDGLRALAALMVVADHVASPTMQALTPHRGMAVDFFFVLSGFVVLHAYEQRLAGPERIGVLAFMRIRLIRFWPMLLAAFVVAIAAILLREPTGYSAAQWIGSIGLGLAFLPTPPGLAIYDWTPFPIVGPSYSMFFELVANLTLALIITRLTKARLAWIIAISALLLAVATMHYDTTGMGWRYWGFWGGFPRVMFSFFVGVALYQIWRARRLPSMPAWLAFVLLAAALCAPVTGAWFAPYQLFAGFVVFPLIVLFAAGSKVTGAAERACLRLGALSYGFYLLHAPLIALVEVALAELGIEPSTLDVALYVGVVAAALALTALLERYYETPFRRWLVRRFPPPPRASAAPT
jgi:peptidoglycan/LPS O-acetylase OafA/YrhL